MLDQQQTIYTARTVRTMDRSRPTAEAVLVHGDRIRAVGSLEELRVYGPAKIDDRYADRVLFPGFVEAHSHVMSGGLWHFGYVGNADRTDPSGRVWPGIGTIDGVIRRLRELEHELTDPDEPLTAWGFDPIFFSGERLDKRHLDQVSGSRPIVILHTSLHTITVNSAVLRRDRITADLDVVGLVKDENGQPNGELRESLAMRLCSLLSDGVALQKIYAGSFENFARDARNHGVTTATDLGVDYLLNHEGVQMYESAVTEDFPIRLSVFQFGVGNGTVPPAEVTVQRMLELRSRSTPRLRFGHIKCMLDGAIQSFTAKVGDPGYLGSSGRGVLTVDEVEFRSYFEEFHRAGLLVHTHCNGDEATQLFLDAVEESLQRHPRWDHRHTVTHSQLSTPAQYRRMAALGMCANVFANHLLAWGDQHAEITLGLDRAERMNAAASALAAGVPLALHSDTPVTPLDPLATAANAVTRRTRSGRTLGAGERISVADALRAVTIGAAYQLKMDDEIGTISSGKYADLAVLDRDPLLCEGEELREIRVFGTMTGGLHYPAEIAVPVS